MDAPDLPPAEVPLYIEDAISDVLDARDALARTLTRREWAGRLLDDELRAVEKLRDEILCAMTTYARFVLSEERRRQAPPRD